MYGYGGILAVSDALYARRTYVLYEFIRVIKISLYFNWGVECVKVCFNEKFLWVLRSRRIRGRHTQPPIRPLRSPRPSSGHLAKKSAKNPAAVIGRCRTWPWRRPITAAVFLAGFFAKCPDWGPRWYSVMCPREISLRRSSTTAGSHEFILSSPACVPVCPRFVSPSKCVKLRTARSEIWYPWCHF